MSVQRRNNVHVEGSGDATLVFAHGFGCDQSMWRFLAPHFAARYRTVLFDLVGSGQSDHAAYERGKYGSLHGFGCDQSMWRFLAPHFAARYRTVLFDLTGSGQSDHAAYERGKYGSLHGYADDLLEIVDEFAQGPVVFVGHSVSAMIGMLATIKAPGRFAGQVMIGPSACYLNDGYYFGGFSRPDLEELLAKMEAGYLDWSAAMAPLIMGAPNQPDLGKELTDSFCRNNPDIARHFARVTFLSDHREDVPHSSTPALILQCTDDLIAPRTAGEFLHRRLPHATLSMIENIGHCAHMSAPGACAREIDTFLEATLR